MIKNMLITLLLLTLALPMVSIAVQAQEIVKDTVYFMKDDNEFSPEEMDEEAEYMYERCTQNSLRSTYYDCACIAGAFRQEREKKGPYMPQEIIMNSLFSDNERGCTNTVTIAGSAYEKCMARSKIFRDRETNNKEYCECVARKTAKDFKKRPYLNANHLENITVDALIACEG